MKEKYVGKVCPYCKTLLTEDDRVAFCSECDMPHHLSCWQDNHGCTTFGCKGHIKEIVGQFVEKERKEQGEKTAREKLELLSESKEIIIIPDAELAMENTTLVIDRTTEQLYASCTFRCIGDKKIKAVLVEIICIDVWGNVLGEPVPFQYLDLDTKRNTLFGQATKVALADNTTRKIRVIIKKILYSDGTILDVNEKVVVGQELKLLSIYLNSESLAEEYTRETTPKAQYVPEKSEEYWRCTCGSLNKEYEKTCSDCGSSLEQLLEVLDREKLEINRNQFLENKRAQEARKVAEEADRIQKMEAQAKIDQERKKREVELAEKTARKRKRRKKTIKILIILLIVVALLGCGGYFWGIPYYHYLSATKALENGEYDNAREAFLELDGFMDSDEMANFALYQKAQDLMQTGDYKEAIKIFKSLGDYKDSETQVNEAKYLWAEKYSSNEQYKAAYELYVELGNYKESSNKVLTTMLLWEAKALSASDRWMATEFAYSVKLQPSQYDAFYTTLAAFITAHDSADYWVDSWSTTGHSDNVYKLLQMLPSSYEDTNELLKLFRIITTASDIYEELFRHNGNLVNTCWPIEFLQDLAKSDRAITYFLEGYWSNGSYYLNFYEDDDGSTSCYYTLPTPSKPAGVKYYDIENMIFIWEDANSKELAKVYRIEIVDYDIIKVYCYSNGRTYTMYR